MIADALGGKTILVTGSTGFLGKSIVEKCLRSIPDIARINLAIRSSARRPAAERLEREVLSSPAFRRLKGDLGEEGFTKLARAKLDVVEIDLGRDGLGLPRDLRAPRLLRHDAQQPVLGREPHEVTHVVTTELAVEVIDVRLDGLP